MLLNIKLVRNFYVGRNHYTNQVEKYERYGRTIVQNVLEVYD